MAKFTILFLLMLSVTAQTPAPDESNGRPNGRYWQGLSFESKLYLLVGFHEGFFQASLEARDAHPSLTLDKINRSLVRYMPQLSMGEIIKGVDRIYDDPENLILPIVDAFDIFAAKAKGANPAGVQALAAKHRSETLEVIEHQKKEDIFDKVQQQQ